MPLKILPHGRLQELVAEEQGYHRVDVRTFGPGERIVFLPYTREVFAATQAWTRRVFPALPEPAPYDEAVLS